VKKKIQEKSQGSRDPIVHRGDVLIQSLPRDLACYEKESQSALAAITRTVQLVIITRRPRGETTAKYAPRRSLFPSPSTSAASHHRCHAIN